MRGFKKDARCAVFSLAAPAAKIWKRNISSASERVFAVFLSEFVVADLPQKNGGLEHKNALAFCQLVSSDVAASSYALWRVLSNKVIWALGQCWIDTKHIHTSEGDSPLFQSSLLSTVTVTPNDWDYVNRSASVRRFRIESTNSSRRVRLLVFIPQGACAWCDAYAKKVDLRLRIVTVPEV